MIAVILRLHFAVRVNDPPVRAHAHACKISNSYRKNKNHVLQITPHAISVKLLYSNNEVMEKTNAFTIAIGIIIVLLLLYR